MRGLWVFAILALALFCAAPASAQRLVTAITDEEISIHSTFSGETLTLFGTIEPEPGASRASMRGPFDIIIVIRGPAVDRVARRKTNEWGIWLNTEKAVFESFPSYFQVISTAPLKSIASAAQLAELDILPIHQAEISLQPGTRDRSIFIEALLRLMTERGHFGVQERGVAFRSEQLYSTRLQIPADVPNGSFLAHTYLFRDGQLVARDVNGFTVRKTGFERFLGSSADRAPWAYGFACVMLAIGTGWLGGVLFRR